MDTEHTKNGFAKTATIERLNERLNEEKTVQAIDRLLARIDTLEKAVSSLTVMMERGPGLVAMTMDMADEGYRKTNANGVSIENRLGAALQIAEKLTAPAMVEKLDGLLGLADQAPGLIAMTMDMADEGYRKANANGVSIENRLGAALQIAEKLTAPAMVEKLDGLLSLADQAPGLIAMTMDMADEGYRKANANGVSIENRLGAALQIAEKLTAPAMVEKLDGLLGLADQAPGLVAMMVDMVDEEIRKASSSGIDVMALLEVGGQMSTAVAKAKEMPEAKVGGIFSMLKTMRDPDRQRAIGYLMNITKALGQELKK